MTTQSAQRDAGTYEDVIERLDALSTTIAHVAARPVDQPTSDALGVAVSAFTGLGYALSARALLLLALLGTFVLAIRATDTLGIVILATWGALTVLPTTVLEIRKGRSQ